MGWREEELLFNGGGISAEEYEKALEMDGGDDCIITHLILQNCIPKFGHSSDKSYMYFNTRKRATYINQLILQKQIRHRKISVSIHQKVISWCWVIFMCFS